MTETDKKICKLVKFNNYEAEMLKYIDDNKKEAFLKDMIIKKRKEQERLKKTLNRFDFNNWDKWNSIFETKKLLNLITN